MAFTSLVKNMNERQLIDCLRDGQMYTKQELAGKSGLSFPTVSKLVDELVDRGMLLALGTQGSSPGGRRAGLFRMDGDFAHVLTLFLQGKTVCYGVFDALEKQIYRKEKECRQGQPSVELMKEILNEVCSQDEKIAAAAVGVPGGVHGGTICYIDGYEELKGRELERELTDSARIPVTVSNNMNALAFGLSGKQEKREENLVCIHLAENGPGCGAVVNGRPVNGFCGFNGEVGFMPLFGERTLQEVALGGFAGVTPGEYLGRLITCICTVLNPPRVILYLEQDWGEPEEEIRMCCEKFMPAAAVPQFVFADSYREDYMQGLMVLGTEMLFSQLTPL